MWITIGKDLMETSKGTKQLLYSTRMTKNYKKGNEDVTQAVNEEGGNTKATRTRKNFRQMVRIF